MCTMVLGVAHLSGFGVAYLVRLVNRKYGKKVDGDLKMETGSGINLNEK